MYFTIAILAVTAATTFTGTAVAAPRPVSEASVSTYQEKRVPKTSSNDCYCLSDGDAAKAADIFRALIQEYSDELALDALTEDFVDYASSVNIIMNHGGDAPKSLTAPTFDSRQAFMDGQGSQPQIPFKKLHIFHGCDSVSMRWMTKRSAKGQATESARYVRLDHLHR